MCPTHLLHETGLLEAQPQDRYAEHGVVGQDDLVLTQGISDRAERGEVVAPIDLDDQPNFVPANIQIDPPIG